MEKYDALIIGANNSGLVCGAILAKEGLKTVIVEATKWVGGTGMTIPVPEIDPEVRVNPAATGQGWVNKSVREDLELDKYGFENWMLDPSLTTVFPEGDYLSIWYDPDKAAEEIARFSEEDAVEYKAFLEKWKPVGAMMMQSMTQHPPTYAQIANGMISSTPGAIGFRDIFFKGIHPLLKQTFENDFVRRAFIPLLEGSNFGPKNTTPLFTIAHLMQPWGAIKHGYAQLIEAEKAAALDNGCEIRMESKVVEILTKDGEAYGVKLESGEEILADRVISNLELGQMVDLVGKENFDDFYLRQVQDIEYEAQGCTLSLIVDEMPDFGFPEDRFNGWFGFGPSYDEVEYAYCQYNCGQIPDELQIIGFMPDYIEAQHNDDHYYAPEGKHVITCFVFPLPPEPKGSTWAEKKQELYDKFEKKILQYAPNLEGHVLGVAGYTPGELAEKFNMTNGDIMHGMMYWGQLMGFRPMPGWANYQTPIKNLYLSGAPVDHGGLTGATGYTAAHTVLGNIGKK